MTPTGPAARTPSTPFRYDPARRRESRLGDRCSQTTTEASRASGGGFLDDSRLFWAAERYELSKGLVTAVRVVARNPSGSLSHGLGRLLPGIYALLRSSTPFGGGVLGNAGVLLRAPRRRGDA